MNKAILDIDAICDVIEKVNKREREREKKAKMLPIQIYF